MLYDKEDNNERIRDDENEISEPKNKESAQSNLLMKIQIIEKELGKTQ